MGWHVILASIIPLSSHWIYCHPLHVFAHKKSCWFILFKTIHKWHINCIIHILGFSHQFTITIISPKMVVDCTIFQYIYLKQTMTVATHEQSPHHWRWLWITISAGEPQILVILFVFCFCAPQWLDQIYLIDTLKTNLMISWNIMIQWCSQWNIRGGGVIDRSSNANPSLIHH